MKSISLRPILLYFFCQRNRKDSILCLHSCNPKFIFCPQLEDPPFLLYIPVLYCIVNPAKPQNCFFKLKYNVLAHSFFKLKYKVLTHSFFADPDLACFFKLKSKVLAHSFFADPDLACFFKLKYKVLAHSFFADLDLACFLKLKYKVLVHSFFADPDLACFFCIEDPIPALKNF